MSDKNLVASTRTYYRLYGGIGFTVSFQSIRTQSHAHAHSVTLISLNSIVELYDGAITNKIKILACTM